MSTDRTSGSRLEPGTLLTFATVLFGLSVLPNSPNAGIACVFAGGLCAWALWMGRRRGLEPIDPKRHETVLFAAVLIFSAFGLAGWAPWTPVPASELLERAPFGVWAVLAMLVFMERNRPSRKILFVGVVAIVLVTTAAVGMLHVRNTSDFGVDVFWLHRAAAEAIANGENPYTDAVEVANGAVTAEPGETIVGYPYPPITALVYSAGEWGAGDSRYASLASWVGALAVVGVMAVKSLSRRDLFVVLLLASIPGWPMVLRAAWTEPFTLLLISMAFALWRRPWGSGSFLGLGLASKQYMAVTLPVLLLHRDQIWKKRAGIAAAFILLVTVPAALWDPQAFWSAAVEFHLTRPLRTDSVNIVGALASFGIDWAPPHWLGPVVAIVIGVAVGKASKTRATFVLGIALTLTGAFLLASQALANYWFLVAGLTALTLMSSPATSAELSEAPST